MPSRFDPVLEGTFVMKALCIATALALFGGSAAHAGSILDTLIRGRQLKVGDCGNGTCSTISWGKQKFVVRRSDIPSALKDLDLGNRLARERGKTPAPSGWVTPVGASPPLHTEDQTVISSRSNEPAAARNDDRPAPRIEESPNPTPITKNAVAPAEQKVVAVPVPAAAPVVSDAESPIGEWNTEDGEGRVQIRPCGQALCGVIAAASPDDTDRHNPDAGKRDRPLLGLAVLIDMKPTKKERWDGQVYNPKSGNTYASNMTLKSADVLRVEGCVLGGFFCGGQTWTRANKTPHDRS
jgi:uncharacterized protein (DUF2147 family)